MESVVGSIPYMANEIMKGSYEGPPVDIFACGVILFNLITVKPFFKEAGDKLHIKFLSDPVAFLKSRDIELLDKSAIDLI